jgi:hypothetical protein
MPAVTFASGQVGEDPPCLVGFYDSLEDAKKSAPDYFGVAIVDLDTGKVFERCYRAKEFTELRACDALDA